MSRAIDFIDEGDSEVGPTDVRFSLRISEENVTSHAKNTGAFAQTVSAKICRGTHVEPVGGTGRRPQCLKNRNVH